MALITFLCSAERKRMSSRQRGTSAELNNEDRPTYRTQSSA